MTNKDLFILNASSDFEKVEEYLRKGYTETSEWKERLEALSASLNVLLMEMGNERIR